MLRLLLIRHGETLWNAEGRYQGQMNSPLTELGRKQAQAVGIRLAGENPDLIVSSDLGRAMQTAEQIRKHHPEARFEEDDQLRERHFGIFQGLRPVEALAAAPEAHHRYQEQSPDYRIPEGESLRDLYTRANRRINHWAAELGEGTLIVVAHGGIIGQFLRYVVQLSLEPERRYKFVNCAFNHFQCENGTWYLVTWGDVSHLSNLKLRDDIV